MLNYLRMVRTKAALKKIPGVVVAKKVRIKKTELAEYVNIAHHAEISNAVIGKRSSIGRYTKIQFAQIGKYCSISWNVTIGALGHPLHSISTHAFSYRKQFGLCKDDAFLNHEKVFIGNDVWIGCEAIIMPGVQLGDGSVIGAGAVVTKSVAPYEVVAGVPAKHIDYRFEPEIINDMEKIKWWDLPDDRLASNIELFSPFEDLTKNDNILLELKKICGLYDQ